MKEEKKLINKHDLILLTALIILGLAAFLIITMTRDEGKTVNIYSDGEPVQTFSMEEDTEYIYTCEEGKNEIEIKDGKVCVRSADCPDKVCVNQGSIEKSGETIICIPHRLVIEVSE